MLGIGAIALIAIADKPAVDFAEQIIRNKWLLLAAGIYSLGTYFHVHEALEEVSWIEQMLYRVESRPPSLISAEAEPGPEATTLRVETRLSEGSGNETL